MKVLVLVLVLPQRWRRGDDVPNGDQPPTESHKAKITPRQLTRQSRKLVQEMRKDGVSIGVPTNFFLL